MRSSLHTRGTSLIEVLLYITLYSIVMVGIITSVFTITVSSAREETKALVSQEGNFVAQKIACCIAGEIGATSISDLVSSRLSVHDVVVGTHPVSVSFTLSATSSDGHVVSQEFYASK